MKLLLISDNTMDVDDKGFPQTLYNIFSFIQPAEILCITSSKAYKKRKPSAPFTSRYITYNFQVISFPVNRFTVKFKKIEDWINYSYNYCFKVFSNIKASIKYFNPDVIVLASNGAESVFMFYKLKTAFRQKKVFPYFMDDWMAHSNTHWLGGSSNMLAKKLLSENSFWLMISKSLADILSEKFSVKYKRLLEIHNPVQFKNPAKLPVLHQEDNYTFVYAGSLWAMHFDALLVMCKAINILSKTKKVRLIIYTTQEHWNWRKNELHFCRAQYGGNIPYNEIHSKLVEADCLLLTSSFEKKWYTHTKGSVQTKLTDYMNAGRLIISCGPDYSANNEFIKKYECGVCIETNNEDAAARQLENILNNMSSNEVYVSNAIKALKENFTFEKVHQNLKSFFGEN